VKQSKQYFVRILGTRAGWPDNMTPDEEKVMTEHYYYLKDLVKRRKVYMAGPVFDAKFGLIVLSVDSEREAKEIMDNEPSVKAGVHTYKMSAMRVSLLVDHQSAERYVGDPSDRILSKEIIIPGTLDDVWRAWTTTEGVKSFFAPDARVELRLGGPYEIYFVADSPPGDRKSVV